eukprot:TRINITY_DN2379_c0_g1_i1.p1 TRINITY_DN2379_c0_g1~~TRINITY_DN2379_c0_g1_i1.p1  ORF type:complete len:1047 (-),score=231.77 TRINITY_DN2379_c0_g1_i1:139-3279(-)
MVIPASTQFKLPPPGFTLQKFVLYETRNRFFLVGSERTKTLFRVLKIDRTVTDTVSITEDNMLYNRHQIQELLTMIDDGNRSQGGLNKLCAAYGILGFIRFLHGYYLMLITSRRKVGKIGPNFIYGIDDIAYIYIPPSFPKTQTPELQEEMKYKGLFLGLDLTRDFYFSYTYDLTHTLQHNMTPDSHATVPPPPCEVLPPQEYQQSGEESTGKHSGNSSNSSSAHSSTANLNDIPKKIEPVNYELSGMFKKQSTKKKRQVETNPLPQSPPVTPKERPTPPYNDMFVWNNFLLEPLLSSVSSWDWILPIIHGYFIQSTVSIFGRPLSIVLIARRSRFFAGTRFLKRGLNEQGYVGNDVETEQILEDTEEENFTSYVQVRGSIPLFWFQDNSKMVPKPSIMMQRCDPYYASTILHFKDLFQRYGCPVTILNLVKSNEKRPRESILRDEFRDACKFINELLPASHKIVYCAWDFHQAAKNKESDHLGWLASFANQTLTTTKFFHSGAKLYSNILREEMKGHSHHSTSYASGQTQCGIVRTNCIDSLDRTNAAQFCIGMAALGQQLYAMGWADDQNIGFESEIVQLLIEMYEGLGNQIALQYGGSELANTIKTYTKNSLVSQTRDALTAVRRYYNNTFTDQEKQGSINLFLGYYVPWKAKEKVPLWELDTDYYLHNQQDNPVYMLVAYTDWWNNSNKFAQNNNNNNNNNNGENSVIGISPPNIAQDFKVGYTNQEYTYLERYQPYKVTYFDRLLTFRFVERAVTRPSLALLQSDPSLTSLGWYSATPTGSSSGGSLRFGTTNKRFSGAPAQPAKQIENTKTENHDNKEKEKQENKESTEPEKLVGLKRWLPVGLKQKLKKQSSALSLLSNDSNGNLRKSTSKDSVTSLSPSTSNSNIAPGLTREDYKPLTRFNMELLEDPKEHLLYTKYVSTCNSIAPPPFELRSPQVATYYGNYIKTVTTPETPDRDQWKLNLGDAPLSSVPSFPMSHIKNNNRSPNTPQINTPSTSNQPSTTLSPQDQASLLYYGNYCKQTSERLFFVDDESRSLYHR